MTLYGYERTVTFPGGHRNIISTRRDLAPFPISDQEHSGVESYGTRLFPFVRRQGDIAIPHTTATNMGTDWRESDPVAQPVVEVYQAHRGSYEAPDAPGKAGAPRQQGFVSAAWAKGLRLGVIASSDHESTHQSYACVYAPKLTAESILQSLKQRLTYAATDNIVVTFEASGNGNTYAMGQELEIRAAPSFRTVVHGTNTLQTLELIRDNRVLLTRSPQNSSDRFGYVDASAQKGSQFYYVRVRQADGQMAWSSPIWIEIK